MTLFPCLDYNSLPSIDPLRESEAKAQPTNWYHNHTPSVFHYVNPRCLSIPDTPIIPDADRHSSDVSHWVNHFSTDTYVPACNVKQDTLAWTVTHLLHIPATPVSVPSYKLSSASMALKGWILSAGGYNRQTRYVCTCVWKEVIRVPMFSLHVKYEYIGRIGIWQTWTYVRASMIYFES